MTGGRERIMFHRTAVIADAGKASAKSIKRRLSRSGYKVIMTDSARKPFFRRTHNSIDLLILFRPSWGDAFTYDLSDKGLIIGISRINETARKLKEIALLSSYGSEQLLRERYINSTVDISFIRIRNGDAISSGLHDLAEEDIAEKIASAAFIHFADPDCE